MVIFYSCVNVYQRLNQRNIQSCCRKLLAQKTTLKSLHRLTSDDDWMEFGADGAIVEHGKVNIEN